jgi:ribose transport system ATP-binding protein
LSERVPPHAGEPLLSLRHVTARYGANVVLRDVALSVHSGEVHAIVGQNGSGKSTLIKTLAGYLRPESGARAWLDREELHLGAPSAAHHARLHFIHQSLNLIPTLSGLDNIALGVGYPTRWGVVRWREHRRRSAALIRSLDTDVDLDRPVAELSLVEQTTVAIARAMRNWPTPRSVLVLDEPTAALPDPDVERLFQTIRAIAERGAAVIFVSHRLEEVLQLAHRVTVLRGGEVVAAARSVAGLDEAALVELMLGSPLESLAPAPHVPRSDVVCSVEALAGTNLTDVSFAIHGGEILGVAGLDGSGRETLAETVFGAVSRERGSVTIDGSRISPEPVSSIAAGIGLVPAERLTKGCHPSLSVTHNVTIAGLRPLVRRWGSLDEQRERAEVGSLMRDVELLPFALDSRLAAFSGGNQQKAVVAKWLRLNPKVLILDEPAQGIDVGAKVVLFDLIAAAARRGMAVLMCSAVAEDLTMLCDRVIVLRHGLVASELKKPLITPDAITALVLAA